MDNLLLLQMDGDQIVFTNSLVYAENLTSPVKYFSEVVLTHSCSYPLEGYKNVVNYIVYSKNYTIDSAYKGTSDLDIK